MSDLRIEIVQPIKPPADKSWMTPELETVWSGIAPWVPRVGDTVTWGEWDREGTVKYVIYHLDERKVTVELEP